MMVSRRTLNHPVFIPWKKKNLCQQNYAYFPFNTFANNRAILGQKLTLNCNRVITIGNRVTMFASSPMFARASQK